MSEGADSSARTCENSLTTLKPEDKTNAPPPDTARICTGRRPRFGTSSVPPSPYVWVDGRKLRSALAYTKKWPPRRVSFPTNDTHLVTGYLEPANPWRYANNVNHEDLISAYKESCVRHNTDPLESILNQLKNLDISEDRCNEFNLKGHTIDQNRAETLEEIFKRIQFDNVNLEATSLNEESSVILFDMLEYYESAKHLNISCNPDIGIRGWQACSHMIKKTQCLEQLEAKDVMLNEQYMNILSRALRLVCHLHVLKLENCGLSGRSINILVTALKMNTGIRELYLADNGLNLYDAIQLGSLLRLNCHIQLLDISNNNVQDDGVRDILDGLINQINEDKDGKGLNILVLWNNSLTKQSSPYFARIIAHSKTLETLNVGQNSLTDEMLITVKDALKKNRVLLQLGMQSTEITCDGVIALSEVMECNQVLQRIDLRDNSIRMTGMQALTIAMKKNNYITQLDLDDKPREKIDGSLRDYLDLVAEIRSYCSRNEVNRPEDKSPEDEENSQHQSRFISASSRKISLTCQTLPCSPRSMTPVQSNELGKSISEPKRSGGRLRSPAPSPIPSPVASPIPSPSRNRFVVSKVPEASLRSSDSSASSSPVTPPSFGSLSTCFFSGSTAGSSRFRVSIVESASPEQSPKPIVAAASKATATIGFNFTVDTIESTDSDDSDNVFRSEPATSNINDVSISSIQKSDSIKESDSLIQKSDSIVENTIIEKDIKESTRTSVDVKDDSTKESSRRHVNKIQPQDSMTIIKLRRERYTRDNQNDFLTLSEERISESIENEDDYMESTNDSSLQLNENIDNEITKTNPEGNVKTEGVVSTEQINEPTKEMTESETRVKPTSTVQKHTSNLEKLLSLFQHPGSLFSESTSVDRESETKYPLQDSVNSMMALGDRFQQYLRDGKTCKTNVTETSAQPINVSSLSSRTKSIKPQLSSIQSLTSMFASLKFDTNVNHLGTCTKNCRHCTKSQCNALDDDKKKSKESDTTTHRDESTNVGKRNDENVSSSNNQSLPENVQSKDNVGHSNKELVLDVNRVSTNTMLEACSDVVNDTSSVNATIAESKTTICVPKLTDIPEYSTLDIRCDNNAANVGVEYEYDLTRTLDAVNVEKQCDSTTTDSINLTSDSKSSSCNVICDIKIINDNMDTADAYDEKFVVNSNENSDRSFVCNTQCEGNEAVSFTCTKNANCKINNESSLNCCAIEIRFKEDLCSIASNNITNIDNMNNIGNIDDVTEARRIEESNEGDNCMDSHDISKQNTENVKTCHKDDSTCQMSTTVNSTTDVPKPELSFISKVDSYECVNSQTIANDRERNCEKNHEENQEQTHDETQKNYIEGKTENSESKELSLPNSTNVRQTILKNVDVDNSSLEVTKSLVHNENTIPMVILSSESLDSSKGTLDSASGIADKDTEDLIFCITDISPVGVEETLSSDSNMENWTRNMRKLSNSLIDLSQTSHSPTNLVIQNSDALHRNSQDSGIEESNLSNFSNLEENIPESVNPQPRESFQESVDSGIDSECSSVCVKADSGMDVVNETSVLQKTLQDAGIHGACGRINDFTDYESDVVSDVQHVGINDVGSIGHSYFEMMKCTVVTPDYPITKISITDTISNGVTPEESGIMIAESSTIVHATSPK